MRQRLWLAFLLVLTGAPGPGVVCPTRSFPAASVLAQEPDEGMSRLWRLRSWVAAVEEHEPGAFDPAAFSVNAWAASDLQNVVRDVAELARFLASAQERAARSGRAPTMSYQGRTLTVASVQELLGLTDAEVERGDANRVFKRGALFHADIAMLAPPHTTIAELSATDLQDMVYLYRDGRLQGVESAGVHWRLGRTLLDEVKPDPARDDMVRLWYQATSAYLQTFHAFVYAAPHFDRARHLFPGDAELLLYEGAMHECIATPRVQAAMLPTKGSPTFASNIKSARIELQQAESSLRQAVKVSPELPEARVRLGHVLDLLGRHDEAVEQLRKALSMTEDGLLIYYANLFLGQAEETLGRREDARLSYERAAARYPQAQSPRLGLSQLARRYGDRAGALDAIQQVLDLPAAEGKREDPWWYYNEIHVPDVERRLGDMRTAFASEPAP